MIACSPMVLLFPVLYRPKGTFSQLLNFLNCSGQMPRHWRAIADSRYRVLFFRFFGTSMSNRRPKPVGFHIR